MRDHFNGTDRLFFVINAFLAILTFVLFSLEDTTGFMLLFLTIFCVNAVCALAVFNVLKNVALDFKKAIVVIMAVVFNIATFSLITYYLMKLFVL